MGSISRWFNYTRVDQMWALRSVEVILDHKIQWVPLPIYRKTLQVSYRTIQKFPSFRWGQVGPISPGVHLHYGRPRVGHQIYGSDP